MSDGANPAGGDETPVAQLRVFMDTHDMGQSLAPNPPFKSHRIFVTDAAESLPLGEYDLFTRPTAPAGVPTNIEDAVSRVEDDIAAGKMGASAVFTRMRYLLKLASPVAPAGVPTDEQIKALWDEHSFAGLSGQTCHNWLEFARAVLSAGAPVVPMQDAAKPLASNEQDGPESSAAGMAQDAARYRLLRENRLFGVTIYPTLHPEQRFLPEGLDEVLDAALRAVPHQPTGEQG